MGKNNQLKIKISLCVNGGGAKKIRKVLKGPLVVIFLAICGEIGVFFVEEIWKKEKIYFQAVSRKFFHSWRLNRSPLRGVLLVAVFNVSVFSLINNNGMMLTFEPASLKENTQIVSAENLKIDKVKTGETEESKAIDLKKISQSQKTLEDEIKGGIIISLEEKKCLKDKKEKKSSELCGKDPKDEELDKDLARLDYLERLKKAKSVNRPKIINARSPAVYKTDSLGRKVCDKSNDKPSKSDKGKGRHMDMECCLDPDEYPNPHCYYPSGKYGKYLK